MKRCAALLLGLFVACVACVTLAALAPQPAAARVVVARNWRCRQRCAEKYRTCVPLCRRPTPQENSVCLSACGTAMQACYSQCTP